MATLADILETHTREGDLWEALDTETHPVLRLWP